MEPNSNLAKSHGMGRTAFSTIALLLIQVSLPAHGHYISHDISHHQDVFAQPPDDRRNGLVNRWAPMTLKNIMAAYEQGVFPWSEAEWYNPPQRGVLFLNELHIGRSDRKIMQRMLASGEYTITEDKDFDGVIRGCADMERFKRNCAGQVLPAGEWLTPTFVRQYNRLFNKGHAHSVEVWHKGRLVGGLYGMFVHGVFSGESMFRLPDHPNVNKLALLHLVEKLQRNGHTFIDTQMAVGLAGKWGARKIPRDDFLTLLAEAHAQDRPY